MLTIPSLSCLLSFPPHLRQLQLQGDFPSDSSDTSSLLPPRGLDTHCSPWWESFPPDIFMPSSLISWRSLFRCLLIKRLPLPHLCKDTHVWHNPPLPCFTFLCCSQHHLSFKRLHLIFLILPCGRQTNAAAHSPTHPPRCSRSNPWNLGLYCA